MDCVLGRVEELTAKLSLVDRTLWVETTPSFGLLAAYCSPVRMKSRPDTTRGLDFLEAERWAEELLLKKWTPDAEQETPDGLHRHLLPSQRPRIPEIGCRPGEHWDERFFLKPDEEDRTFQRRRIKPYAFTDDTAPVFLDSLGNWQIAGGSSRSANARVHLAALHLGVSFDFLWQWTTQVREVWAAQPSRRLGIKIIGRNTQGPIQIRSAPKPRNLPGGEWPQYDADREDLDAYDQERRDSD